MTLDVEIHKSLVGDVMAAMAAFDSVNIQESKCSELNSNVQSDLNTADESVAYNVLESDGVVCKGAVEKNWLDLANLYLKSNERYIYSEKTLNDSISGREIGSAQRNVKGIASESLDALPLASWKSFRSDGDFKISVSDQSDLPLSSLNDIASVKMDKNVLCQNVTSKLDELCSDKGDGEKVVPNPLESVISGSTGDGPDDKNNIKIKTDKTSIVDAKTLAKNSSSKRRIKPTLLYSFGLASTPSTAPTAKTISSQSSISNAPVDNIQKFLESKTLNESHAKAFSGSDKLSKDHTHQTMSKSIGCSSDEECIMDKVLPQFIIKETNATALSNQSSNFIVHESQRLSIDQTLFCVKAFFETEKHNVNGYSDTMAQSIQLLSNENVDPDSFVSLLEKLYLLTKCAFSYEQRLLLYYQKQLLNKESIYHMEHSPYSIQNFDLVKSAESNDGTTPNDSYKMDNPLNVDRGYSIESLLIKKLSSTNILDTVHDSEISSFKSPCKDWTRSTIRSTNDNRSSPPPIVPYWMSELMSQSIELFSLLAPSDDSFSPLCTNKNCLYHQSHCKKQSNTIQSSHDDAQVPLSFRPSVLSTESSPGLSFYELSIFRHFYSSPIQSSQALKNAKAISLPSDMLGKDAFGNREISGRIKKKNGLAFTPPLPPTLSFSHLDRQYQRQSGAGSINYNRDIGQDPDVPIGNDAFSLLEQILLSAYHDRRDSRNAQQMKSSASHYSNINHNHIQNHMTKNNKNSHQSQSFKPAISASKTNSNNNSNSSSSYSNITTSNNPNSTPNSNHLYSNQQRLRDLLMEWIRRRFMKVEQYQSGYSGKSAVSLHSKAEPNYMKSHSEGNGIQYGVRLGSINNGSNESFSNSLNNANNADGGPFNKGTGKEFNGRLSFRSEISGQNESGLVSCGRKEQPLQFDNRMSLEGSSKSVVETLVLALEGKSC